MPTFLANQLRTIMSQLAVRARIYSCDSVIR